MEEDGKIPSRINGLIRKDKDVTIIKEIVKDGDYFSGRIKIEYLNEILEFDVSIPKQYPLTRPNSDNISIIFRNREYIGLNHINLDGSVCFHPDKDDDFDRKLLYEIQCLKQWIKEYYILRKEDENYAYLIHSTEDGRIDRLYFTNTSNKFKKGSYGTFRYSIFADDKIGKKKFPLKKLFRIGFNKGEEDTWSKSFIEDLKTKTCKNGLYYFIEQEPLKRGTIGRKGVELWSELEEYFSKEFVEYLYRGLKREFGKSFYHENNLFLIIGYKIPNKEAYEEHWDLIRIPKNRIPIEYSRLSKSQVSSTQKRFIYNLKNNRIFWGSTENIDYSRFFGRGKLSEKITDSRIFLIGCGALGSSLAEILVRGGSRQLILEDFDNIRGGNLCRSNYDLNDIVYFKTNRLTKRLKSISPFVHLGSESKKLNGYDFKVIEEYFNKNIDVIFDCSADPEVTYIIDKINFKGIVFSMAITNNAKSFISITGKRLTEQAKLLFEYVENEPPTYFEGAGCGYPTFEASFNDINTLLNITLKSINYKLAKSLQNETLVIVPDLEKEYSISIDEYEYFTMKNTGSSIHISKKTLEKIKKATRRYYPNEFGGVFIGYRTKDNYIITDILIPDEYKNGKTIFIRHPGSLNERLKAVHDKTNGKIQYLGEWHSHPNGPMNPSSTDRNAMKEIARNQQINNDTPLLMIVAIDEVNFDKCLYIYETKTLKKYERRS